jgi:dolichyl-phosphooligosaccharide-protein glycotransferase
MLWLKDHSPAPFDPGDSYYYARYPAVAPSPGFSIMNWWDHGYWITQIARRVPVSNPTQERASIAGRFYASTDEHEAGAIVDRERARYVLADWELPFRLTPEGAIMGRFQNVVDWAGGEHARYYEVYYRREDGDWTPVWVFHQPYYQSMAYRLMVLGGAAARPANSTSVLVVVDRSDPAGLPFREVVSQMTFATYEAALQAAQLPTAVGRTVVAGLDPWQPAFPVERVTTMRQLHESRSPDQKPTEAPRVRLFEVFR